MGNTQQRGLEMGVRYLIDEHGKRSAIVIPFDQWNDIAGRLEEMGLNVEFLRSEDDEDRASADSELASGNALDLVQSVNNW
jgi:hypothetical protein